MKLNFTFTLNFPKQWNCQFLNFSQMWYVACPQDLMDFPLAGLIQPRTYFCYMFEESNMFQPKISTVLNNLLFALSLSCFLLKWKNEWDKKNAISPYLSKKGRWKSGIGLGQNILGILSHSWLKYSQAFYYCSFQQSTSAFLFKSTLQCWKTDKPKHSVLSVIPEGLRTWRNCVSQLEEEKNALSPCKMLYVVKLLAWYWSCSKLFS